MSSPWCRRQPGPKRGNHQSSDQVATPATGKRPKPTIACWVGSRPNSPSGARASTSFFVLFAAVRRTEFIWRRRSSGIGPAPSVGAPSPSAGGSGSEVLVDDGGVVVVVEGSPPAGGT